MQWVDNGPGWLGVLLASPDRVLALDCGPIDQFIGVAAARDDGSLEVRAFYPVRGAMVEDLPSLAYTPARARRVLINAQAGAPWRADFGIAGPTPQLNQAIQSISRALATATPTDGTPSFDAPLHFARQDRPDGDRLDRLVRGVLRSTLEQLRSRPAAEK